MWPPRSVVQTPRDTPGLRRLAFFSFFGGTGKPVTCDLTIMSGPRQTADYHYYLSTTSHLASCGIVYWGSSLRFLYKPNINVGRAEKSSWKKIVVVVSRTKSRVCYSWGTVSWAHQKNTTVVPVTICEVDSPLLHLSVIAHGRKPTAIKQFVSFRQLKILTILVN